MIAAAVTLCLSLPSNSTNISSSALESETVLFTLDGAEAGNNETGSKTEFLSCEQTYHTERKIDITVSNQDQEIHAKPESDETISLAPMYQLK